MLQRSFLSWAVALAIFVLAPNLTSAQSSQQSSAQPPSVVLPTVTVTAQKEPADVQRLPVSVSAVSSEWLRAGRITWITDAVIFAPNTVVTEFTARKLSNPRIRGIGASPANPAVTTYVDGVPVLNANASSAEFTGVEQVEIVRGPQSALFGRNTLGGVINVTSERPSLSGLRGEVVAPFGNFGSKEVRGSVSTPITDRVAFAVSAGHAQREGFTLNRVTGNDIDERSANFGKAQLLVAPGARWETRLIVSAERAEDGDYSLNDLDAVRSNPFVVERDFEGFTHRSLFNTTVNNRYEGDTFSVTAITGFINWDTDDQTDLDYSALPLATRSNVEEASQFTQEIRVASAPGRVVALSPAATLKWQAGVLFSVDEAPLDTVYLPMAQEPSRTSRIVVRSTRTADDVGAIVRDEVARLDRDLPVYGAAPLTDVVAASAGMPARRVLTGTFAAFALLALVLSAVGLFAIVAYEVVARRSELALRVALGASPASLLAATLRQATTVIVAGVGVGLVVSVWSGKMLASLVPATKAFDLATVFVTAAVLLLVGLSAVLLPARHAARTDPLAVLRAD